MMGGESWQLSQCVGPPRQRLMAGRMRGTHARQGKGGQRRSAPKRPAGDPRDPRAGRLRGAGAAVAVREPHRLAGRAVAAWQAEGAPRVQQQVGKGNGRLCWQDKRDQSDSCVEFKFSQRQPAKGHGGNVRGWPPPGRCSRRPRRLRPACPQADRDDGARGPDRAGGAVPCKQLH